MSVYQINYHLPKQRDYSSLIERIQPYGAWCLFSNRPGFSSPSKSQTGSWITILLQQIAQ